MPNVLPGTREDSQEFRVLFSRTPAMKFLVFLLLCAALCPLASAAELVLLKDGKSEYQIVVPDTLPSPALTECLNQSARLVRTAFQANGVEVSVVTESKRDAAKPSIWLGNTQFAQKQGLKLNQLRDWSYVHRAVGADVILAGNDQPAQGKTDNDRRPNWDRVGTAKAVVDFARQYMGVRFLFPDVTTYTPVSGAAKIDLLKTPAIEYLPTPVMTVPADLNLEKTPLLRLNTAHPAGGGFYDLAHNRFPRVDEVFGSHTWERAVPPEKYWESHPEYFALVSGSRLKPEGGAQYCLSNPAVQELIYRDLASWMDRGYASVDLGQPDGFRECQCEDCAKLYNTGSDWSEKIWIFNRNVAEKLAKSHPGKDVTMMSYILTAKPPKTFTKFPANTCIMLTGTNEQDIEPWRGIEVPRGFTGYVYNWCPNLGSRYTPMRTPGYIETQVKRLAANRIQSLYRDGPGQLFGLEGPVYYTMGRMFDDPERNAAKDLLPEYCEAAFGNKSTAFYMRSFYDQLYHAIALYSDHIGTRCDVWTYQALPGEGRPRKTVQDPFQLIAFLYTPNLLETMDADLTQSEKQAPNDKVKARLALIRQEFDYIRHLARVVHLYQAYQVQPDQSSRDRVLDAIDARNAFIESLYQKRESPWAYTLFPFPGHNAAHLRLAYDGYQEPYANTCLNWDTKSLRNAPAPGKKSVKIGKTASPLTLDSAAWLDTPGHELTVVPPLNKLPRKTTLRFLYDATHLYVRAESELEPEGPFEFPAWDRDRPLHNQEAVTLYLQPLSSKDIFYRIACGANAASKYDAASGFIADVMDPRHNQDDPSWNGDWRADSKIDPATARAHLFFAIPFKTLGVETPSAGMTWRANFARSHALPREKVDRAIWSSSLTSTRMDDRAIFGDLIFE